MATIQKELNSTSFSIEMENGQNSKGETVYKKKTFSNLKVDASPEDIYAVADAIKPMLNSATRNIIINDISTLVQA